jgi:hypothetical protein
MSPLRPKNQEQMLTQMMTPALDIEDSKTMQKKKM